MTDTKETTIRQDHLLHLCRFLEQIELKEYYSLIVEKLKVRDRIKSRKKKKKERKERKKESRLKLINSSSLHSFFSIWLNKKKFK